MKKLRRSNLSDDAYAFVKDLLLSGERFHPGAKINVEELSRDLGVSRTPVWGAIYRLEAEGIVEIVPRQGVYLIRFDPALAQEIYMAREALEGMVARLAAERATPRHLSLLEAALEKQRACLADADAEGYASAALEFHRVIVEAAANGTLKRMLATVYAQIQAMRWRTRDLPTRMPTSADDHQKIVTAIAAHDAGAAEAAARSHIRALGEEVAQSVQDDAASVSRGARMA